MNAGVSTKTTPTGASIQQMATAQPPMTLQAVDSETNSRCSPSSTADVATAAIGQALKAVESDDQAEATAAAAKRAAIKAKIAEKYAAAKAANEAAMSSAVSSQAAGSTLAPVKLFARGAPVLYDNPKNGRLEFAHVIQVHMHEGLAEYYTIQTNSGEGKYVEGDRLANSSWSAAKVFDDEPSPSEKAVVHVHPYAPPGPRIGVGHHNWRGKLHFHGPKQIFVPSLDLTIRGVGGNGKMAATMGYAQWKNKLLGKK